MRGHRNMPGTVKGNGPQPKGAALRPEGKGMSRALRAPALALVFALLLAGGPPAAFVAEPASAVEPDEILSDPTLEARARAISAELRCLVCQNQSIDDSNAPLARDLRLLVRERLKAGDSNREVKDYLVARYGEFVLLNPPFGWHTLALWLAPVLILAAALAAAWRTLRARAPAGAEAALSAGEEAELSRLLHRDEPASLDRRRSETSGEGRG